MDDQQLRRFVSAELWTLREAAYLLCDKLPPFNEDGFWTEMKSGSDVALAYRALKDSTRTKTLNFIRADGRDYFVRRLVYPADAVAWAKNRDLAVPAALRHIRATAAADGAPAAAALVQHKVGSHVMSTAITLAKAAAEKLVEGSSQGVGPVWTQLEALGRQDRPPQPIVKVTSGGVVYQAGGRQEVYTRKMLSDRMRREKARNGAPRRSS